jgi:hypothetical protein
MAKQKKRDPLKDFVINNLAQGSAHASRGLIKYVRPIYTANSASEPELIGTGVLIAVGLKHFLVTAAHVLDRTGSSTYYIPTEETGDLVVLEGKSVHSVADHKNDLLDIAVVLLSPALVALLGPEIFLSPSDIDLDDIGEPTRVYRVTRRLRASVSAYAANVLPPQILEAAGLERKSHLLVKYRKRHSRTLRGEDVTAPDPHGMSGGPLWKFDPYSPSSQIIQLVGILIEWKRPEGGLLAVRMPLVFAAVSRLCPDIEELLPSPKSVIINTSPDFFDD